MDPTARARIPLVFLASTTVVLFWFLSIAEPCLLALSGANPSVDGNLIALNPCEVTEGGQVVVTVGNIVMRLGALAVLMGLLGFFVVRLQKDWNRGNLAIVAALAATLAFLLYLTLRLVLWKSTGGTLAPIMLAGSAGVSALAVRAGAAQAWPPRRD